MTRAQKLDRVRNLLPGLHLKATRHVGALIEGSAPSAGDDKLTNQDRAAFLLVQGFMASERAVQANTGPMQLGVVMIAQRLPSTPEGCAEWELEASKLKDQRAIEAVAVPAKEPNAA